jgi:hypothetical protein
VRDSPTVTGLEEARSQGGTGAKTDLQAVIILVVRAVNVFLGQPPGSLDTMVNGG